MPTWLIIPLVVVLAAVSLYCRLAFRVYRSLNGLMSKEARLEPTNLGVDSSMLEDTASIHAWAEVHGFEWIDIFIAHFPPNPSAAIAAWRRADGTVLALCRVNDVMAIDLFTDLDADGVVGLTTTSTDSFGMYPKRPGVLGQYFPGATVAELGDRHDDALEFVAVRFALRPVPSTTPFEESFLTSIQRQTRYVRSHVFWPIRAVVWFFRRKRFAGVPVRDRYAGLTIRDLYA